MKKVILLLSIEEEAFVRNVVDIDYSFHKITWIGILASHGYHASSVFNPIVRMDGDGTYIVEYMPYPS